MIAEEPSLATSGFAADATGDRSPSLAGVTGPPLARRMVLGLAGGGLLVLAFLRFVNLGSIARRLQHLDPTLAVLCGAVFLSAFAVRALRWRCFLAHDKVPVRSVISIYLIAAFLNWLLPVQAGELAKTLLLRRSQGIPVSRSLATVAMDKSMDLLPGVALLGVVPFVDLHLSPGLWVLMGLASACVVLGGALFGLAIWRRASALAALSRLLQATLPARVFGTVDPFLSGFIGTLHAISRRPRILLMTVPLTGVAVALDGLFCFLAFRAVGVGVTFPVALFGYTLYNLAYILPTPPGHLGTNELVGLLIFSGVFGFAPSAVGAMFLFSHPWTGILLTVSGLLCLRTMGMSLSTTLRLGSGTTPAAAV